MKLYPVPGGGERKARVRDMPERLRPREEVARVGVEHVADDVLLAIILGSGIPGMNVVDLARDLVTRFGSLGELAKASSDELRSVKGIGKVKAQVVSATLELARRLNEESSAKKPRIKTPEDAARLLRADARLLEREVFWALLLDAKNCLKGSPVEITTGLLDASLVHPREVFREAIRKAAASIVLVHNHPSGDPSPSPEDLKVTRQLIEAGKVIDIQVLDHIILGRMSDERTNDYLSVRESGAVIFSS